MTRTALVTGGASGLGASAADRLRDDGVEVITVDIAGDADEQVDITHSEAVSELATRLGTVDILVNSAGVVGPNAPTLSVSDADWDRTFAINTHGTFAMIRAFAPGMVERGWGRIVNIASMAGKDGNPNLAAYSASKAAVIALTKSVGKELATTGVLVNAIAPAVIATAMNADTDPDVLNHLVSLIPMKRLGEPHEAAALIAFLASDECSFSTGACFDLSGGRATY